jgi:DHA2 family multidrug resistance protein
MTHSLQRLGSDAGDAALKALAATVCTEALVMSFADVFLILTALFLAMATVTVLIKRPQMAGAGGH